MKKSSRRSVIALLGATALGACAAPQIVSQDTDDPFEGGIGGTGIVGLLTDFGSLIVNGLRVEMTNQTMISDAFGPVSASALLPGQALTIYAERRRDAIVARNIRIDHALIGRLDTSGGKPRVNGVELDIERNAPAHIRPEQRVAVSGLWARDRLIVSRIDAVAPGPDLIAGTLLREDMTLSLGGAALSGALQGAQPGQYTTIFGTGNKAGLEAARFEMGRFRGTSSLRQLSVEGYLEPVSANPGYRVAGLGHSFARDLRLAPLDGERAIYFGRYTGLFQARLGVVLPQDYAERRALLGAGYEQGFGGTIFRL